MSDIDKIKQKIKKLEAIPLYDVRGGRQRTSKDNESLVKHRANLRLLENAG